MSDQPVSTVGPSAGYPPVRLIAVLPLLYFLWIVAFYGGFIPFPIGNPDTNPDTLFRARLCIGLGVFGLSQCLLMLAGLYWRWTWWGLARIAVVIALAATLVLVVGPAKR